MKRIEAGGQADKFPLVLELEIGGPQPCHTQSTSAKDPGLLIPTGPCGPVEGRREKAHVPKSHNQGPER